MRLSKAVEVAQTFGYVALSFNEEGLAIECFLVADLLEDAIDGLYSPSSANQ